MQKWPVLPELRTSEIVLGLWAIYLTLSDGNALVKLSMPLLTIVVIIIDHFYIVLFSALQQFSMPLLLLSLLLWIAFI